MRLSRVVDGLWHVGTRVTAPETPGPYCCPPLAATITGAGRLMLALLQHDVERRGGTYLACDTDSLLIVANADGGLVRCAGGPVRLPDGSPAVRALSDAEVDDIVRRFAKLSPYDPSAVSSLLKIEDENNASDGSGRRCDLWGIGISAKRFVLYERVPGGYVIRKASEHGLGLYRRPVADGAGWDKRWPRWVEVVWRRIIDEVEGRPLPPQPNWFRRPAVGQITTSTWNLLTPFIRHDRHRQPAERIRPENFMLVGHVDPLVALPAEYEGQRVTPIAPFSSRPAEILSLARVNRADGRPVQVTTARRGEPGRVRLRTYHDVVRDYRLHPEFKGADPDGGPCLRTTVGYLPRRPVRATMVRHIGKESNRLEEVEEGAITDLDEVQIQYVDEAAEWESVLEVLRRIGVPELARRTGMSERTLRSRAQLGPDAAPAGSPAPHGNCGEARSVMGIFEVLIVQMSGAVLLRVTVMPAEDAGWIQDEISAGLIANEGTPYDLMVWLPEWLRQQGIVDEVEVMADTAWHRELPPGERKTRRLPDPRLARTVAGGTRHWSLTPPAYDSLRAT